MAIKMDGNAITELELHASDGTTTTKQLTEELNLQQKTAIVNGDVTPDAGYDGLSKVVVNVEGGGELPTLTNPASAADILDGKEAIDGNGAKLTGTCTFDADTSDADAIASDIAEGKTAYVNGVKITGTNTGGDEPVYPDEYVTDGLYFCLDAINNAGDHHDAGATSWIDTVGGIEFTQKDTNAPVVGANYIHFDGTNKRYAYSGDIAEPVYCEFVVQAVAGSTKTAFQLKGTGDKLGSLFLYADGEAQCGNTASASSAFNCRSQLQNGIVQTIGATGKRGVMANGKIRFASQNMEHWSDNSAENLVGGYKSNTYPMNGYICAIRFYNRVLTEEEIAQNYAQDVKRFGAGADITGGA